MILVRHQRRAEAAAADSDEDKCPTLDPGGGGGGVSYEGRGEVSIPDKMSNLGCQINFMELIKGCLVWCTRGPHRPVVSAWPRHCRQLVRPQSFWSFSHQAGILGPGTGTRLCCEDTQQRSEGRL